MENTGQNRFKDPSREIHTVIIRVAREWGYQACPYNSPEKP